MGNVPVSVTQGKRKQPPVNCIITNKGSYYLPLIGWESLIFSAAVSTAISAEQESLIHHSSVPAPGS